MGLDHAQNAFIEQQYREMYLPLSIYARSALGSRALAEEAVQDTFRIACAKVNDFISSGNPSGWLMVTLKHVIRNMNRTRARLSSLIVESIPLDEKTMGATTDEVDRGLLYAGSISREDYQLLKRVALDRYSMLEAAEELGISVEVCKKRVQRARAQFRKQIGDEKK